MPRVYRLTCPECGVLYETDRHLDEDLCLACGEWAEDSRRWAFTRERRLRRLTPPEGLQ